MERKLRIGWSWVIPGFFLVGIIALIRYERPRTVHIEYVVPDGFRGAVVITATNDQDWTAQPTETIRIQPDGSAKVPSFDVFRDWHTSTARFESGGELGVVPPVAGSGAKSVEFYVLGGPDSNGEMHCFVGTNDDALRAMD